MVISLFLNLIRFPMKRYDGSLIFDQNPVFLPSTPNTLRQNSDKRVKKTKKNKTEKTTFSDTFLKVSDLIYLKSGK
jgi:hypothetical protein